MQIWLQELFGIVVAWLEVMFGLQVLTVVQTDRQHGVQAAIDGWLPLLSWPSDTLDELMTAFMPRAMMDAYFGALDMYYERMPTFK